MKLKGLKKVMTAVDYENAWVSEFDHDYTEPLSGCYKHYKHWTVISIGTEILNGKSTMHIVVAEPIYYTGSSNKQGGNY